MGFPGEHRRETPSSPDPLAREHPDPALHWERLQPSPRSDVLPELVQDEAGLVRQLAGRHAVGTGVTLRQGLAWWHGHVGPGAEGCT